MQSSKTPSVICFIPSSQNQKGFGLSVYWAVDLVVVCSHMVCSIIFPIKNIGFPKKCEANTQCYSADAGEWTEGLSSMTAFPLWIWAF